MADFRKIKVPRYSAGVEALAPAEPRREIREEIEKMARIYSPPTVNHRQAGKTL